eukprot:TRINITY_DN1542_c0_g1_i2.p1 TRINITY_DN1542_c0_g1~~TRINITY_DN1542_c0_g1_i2.p1  ORF type:complete len:509 (+),score=86.48 TRINITY_DN1542_c0_g1_i2:1221-2747(+)
MRFFNKCIEQSQDVNSIFVLIQPICYENLEFSKMICSLILNKLGMVRGEEIISYFNVIEYLLNLQDSLKLKRMYWILGLPILKQQCQSLLGSWPTFGSYGINSIDDVIYQYKSYLNLSVDSLIEVMTSYKSKLDFICIMAINIVIKAALQHQYIFEYICYLPPHNYQFAKFTDYLIDYLKKQISNIRRYIQSSYNKIETAEETLVYCEQIDKRINSRLNSFISYYSAMPLVDPTAGRNQYNKAQVDYFKANHEGVLKGFQQQYIIGQTQGENLLWVKELEQNLSVMLVEYQVLVTESKPTGVGNLVFPSEIVGNYWSLANIDRDHILNYFVSTRQSNVSYKGKNKKKIKKKNNIMFQNKFQNSNWEGNDREVNPNLGLINEDENVDEGIYSFDQEISQGIVRQLRIESSLTENFNCIEFSNKDNGFLDGGHFPILEEINLLFSGKHSMIKQAIPLTLYYKHCESQEVVAIRWNGKEIQLNLGSGEEIKGTGEMEKEKEKLYDIQLNED